MAKLWELIVPQKLIEILTKNCATSRGIKVI